MYANATPPRSEDQRMAALRMGNQIRSKRARLKKELHDVSQVAGPFIEDPPDWALTMKVRDLLLAIPKIREAKVDRALRTVRVSPTKTLGGLSERQRKGLLDYFAEVHPNVRVAA